MKHFKLLLIFALILTALLSFCAVAEDESEIPPEYRSDFACVYNVESGEMLYSKGADTVLYPAALVKIMTSVLALEHYEKVGNIEITVTESALETLKGNSIKLKAGERARLYDLIAAVSVGGANDAALVVAEAVAGSVDKFVEMMNEKAKELGAEHTQFDNPTGFHSPMMYSTLNDLVKICQWANKNSEFMKLSSTVSYTMPATELSKERVFTNSNLLLDPKHWLRHYYEGTSGMGAGMTNEAGYVLATVYNNDGQTNIVIIVGGKVDGWTYYYYEEAAELITGTKQSFAYKKLITRDEPVFDMKVLYGRDTDHVLLVTSNEVTALLPADVKDEEITTDFTVDFNECQAPVKKGTQMGSLNVYYNGELTQTVPLVAMNSVKRDTFLYIFGGIRSFFSHELTRSVLLLIFSVVLFLFAVAVAIVCRLRYKANQLRKKAQYTHAKRTLN